MQPVNQKVGFFLLMAFYSYADDTQLHVVMSTDDTGPTDSPFRCILNVSAFLQLNQDKTEFFFVIGSER